MIGILLVTHGRLAEELKAAALTIQPEIEQIVAVALEWNQVGDDAVRRIALGPRGSGSRRRRPDPDRHVRRNSDEPDSLRS